MHAAVAKYSKRKQCNLGLRAGIHSGQAIGGVVGTTMQRYHLFGGTMHIAEALEATAPSGAVHLSEAARSALAATGELSLGCGPAVGGVQQQQQQRWELVPVPQGMLQTSKGERVAQRDVGDQPTFVVWPTETPGVEIGDGDRPSLRRALSSSSSSTASSSAATAAVSREPSGEDVSLTSGLSSTAGAAPARLPTPQCPRTPVTVRCGEAKTMAAKRSVGGSSCKGDLIIAAM